MARIPLLAGNWKMHKTVPEAVELVAGLRERLDKLTGVEIAVCPPATALGAVSAALEGSAIALGAQDVFWETQGAFTGLISPLMLVDIGCRFVVIGHSERRGRFGKADPTYTGDMRRVFGDTDDSVNRKALAAVAHGLTPIICVGETIDERRGGETDAIIEGQVRLALRGFTPAILLAGRLVFAYEPVWAIGTGEICESEEANRVIGRLRQTIREIGGERAADAVRLQYGGSVSEKNAAEVMSQPEIDGALVGGASLKADQFGELVRAAAQAAAARSGK
jgi:triosephosphate isomerase